VIRPRLGWALPGVTAQYMLLKTVNASTNISDRSTPRPPRTRPSVLHQRKGDKYATDGTPPVRMRERNNTIIGKWNVRTLVRTEKRSDLTYEMNRYAWHIVGLCETRWKNFREPTEDGHILCGKVNLL